MKTIKEIHTEAQKAHGLLSVSEDSEIRPTNIDDTLRYAEEQGITDIVFDKHSMMMLFWFVSANYRLVPWEIVSSGWIPSFWDITFHKEDVQEHTSGQ